MSDTNVGGPESREVTQRVRRPMEEEPAGYRWWNSWDRGDVVLVMCAVLIILVAALLWRSCNGTNGQADVVEIKKDMASVKTDVETIKDSVYRTNDDGKEVTVLSALAGMDRKLDLLATKEDVSKKMKVTVDTSGLATKDQLSTLATKEDVSKLATTKHLHRVERKLDAHIATEKAEPKEETPVAPPTHKVTIRRVPTYVDVYKPRSP